MGSSPGKTNVMAVRAVEELGTTPRDDRRATPPAATSTRRTGPSYPYAPRTLVDELTEPPMAIRDGEPVALEPMEDGGAYPFPEPIGEGETIYTLHSEVRTFGDSFGCERVHLPAEPGAGGARAGARAWSARPTTRSTPRRDEAVPSSPKTVSAHVVEARGDAAVTVTAVTRGMEEWGLGGGHRLDRRPGRRGGAAAGAGRDRGPRRAAARALRAARGPLPGTRAA